MRQLAWIVVASMAALAMWLWPIGGMADLSRWAASGQQEAQQAMASYLRALKRGDAGALAGLMGLCFAYGFFHAVGPGHGKLVIGGYGMAARVTAAKLSVLALASSLAQATSAVVLVGIGALLFGWTRQQMTGAADDWLAPVSMGAICLVGLWLIWRGVTALASLRRQTGHDHDHVGDDPVCSSCGHRHGPSVEEAQAVSGWKDAFAIIGVVAIRPCTGALFLLLITWSMGIFGAGIAGAFVMGLGTASVTVLVAISAVVLRTQTLGTVAGSVSVAWASGLLQVGAGLLVTIVAGQLTLAALG